MRTANNVVSFSGNPTADLSAGATSDPIKVEDMTWLALVATVTSAAGGLTGTLKLQACVDVGQDTASGPSGITSLSNWVDIPNATATLNANGNFLIQLVDMGYKWVRAVWTNSAGTGTAAVRVNVKGVS